MKMICRLAFGALLSLLPSLSWGQAGSACIISDPAWSTGYASPPSQILQIAYQLTNGYMVAIYPNNIERAFQGVPRGIAQQLSQMTNPTTFFNTNIAPIYHEAYLTAWNGGPCPLLTTTGQWILTH